MAKPKGKGRKPDRSALEREVLRAMREEGWLAPETEAEVLEAETKLAVEQIEMPAPPEHPRELLHRPVRIRTIHHPHPESESTEMAENLARAAREGGKLSPETEQRMKKDRDAAEAKSRNK